MPAALTSTGGTGASPLPRASRTPCSSQVPEAALPTRPRPAAPAAGRGGGRGSRSAGAAAVPPFPSRSRGQHPGYPRASPAGSAPRSSAARCFLSALPVAGRAVQLRTAPAASVGGAEWPGPPGGPRLATPYRRCLSPSWAPLPGSHCLGALVCCWMPIAQSRSLPPSLRPPSSWQGGWESAAQLQHMPSLRSRPGPSAIHHGASQAPPRLLQPVYSRPHRAAGQ